jgi:hypothetical protein
MEKGSQNIPGWEKMPPEELAVELMTSGLKLPGGRADALHLLSIVQRQWGREIANRQRTAHDEMRPYSHPGIPCKSEWDCHVSKVIELAERGVPPRE